MPIYRPDVETLSIWSMMQAGTHKSIAAILAENDMVKAAAAPAVAPGAPPHAYAAAVDLITRATGNCVGQAAVQEIRGARSADLVLNPIDNTLSIYRALHPGTAAAITAAINASGGVAAIAAAGDAGTLVFQLSRMAGRCIGQEIIAEAASLLSITGRLQTLLGGAAKVAAAIKALKAAGAIH